MEGQLSWTNTLPPLTDALPYIDTLTPETRKVVEKMIKEEVERSDKKPRDYLNEMENVGRSLFGGSEVLQEAYERTKAGQKMDVIDSQRMTLPEPMIEDQNDPEEWNKTIDNAVAQLEHQRLRSLNLELSMKYAPEAWKKGNEQASQIEKTYKNETETMKEQISEINTTRKLSQEEIGMQLMKLEKEWYHLISKNFDIRQECDKKRAANAKLQSEISKKQRNEQS